MTRKVLFALCVLVTGLLLGSCSIPFGNDTSLEGTRVALAIQQTSLAMSQAQGDTGQVQPV